MILMNPVVIAVVLLCVLCLLKVDVLMSLIISALVGGMVAGGSIVEVMDTLIGGMGGNANTALSYVLLGTYAFAMAQTGLADILTKTISTKIGGKTKVLLFIIAGIACLSQNLIPVHIAFIPILIPPLLGMMNKMKIDRRAVACSLAFGLKAPYIALPFGFGLIFQEIIATNMTDSGMAIETSQVWTYTWFVGASMLIGLIVAVFVTYKNPREYKDLEVKELDKEISTTFTTAHYATMVAAVVTVILQVMYGNLPLAALGGLIVMIVGGAIKLKEIGKMFNGGVGVMGYIAFVMLVASGFSSVIKGTGAVEELVAATVTMVGGSQLIAAILMVVLGLFITMGIGSSFSTIPLIATLYVPLCLELGFSVGATVILIAAAGALGDAGSPASDTTLGPTSGLNADGQHDHIWDTCVPTFMHYNIPIAIFAVIGAMIF